MDDINESFESALKYLQEGNLEEAERICKEILKFQPENFDVLHFLGVLYYQRRDFDLAIQYIRHALQINPSSGEAYYDMGNAFHGSGRVDEAIQSYQKAVELVPEFADAHSNLGSMFQNKGELDKAVSSYEKALAINPNDADAYYNLGTAFKDMEQFDAAIDCYEKALQQNPNDIDAYYNLGDIFQGKGQLEKALFCYQEAVKLGPDFSDAYCNMGVVLQGLKRPDDAISAFEKAVQLNPNLSEAYMNLGLACREKGQFDEAVTHCQKALSMNPDDPWVYTVLGAVLQSKGRFDEAKNYFGKGLQMNCNLTGFSFQGENPLQEKRQLEDIVDSWNKPLQKSILIAVSVFNREKITQLSLAQTQRYKTPHCRLQVYNDHSTEYNNAFIEPYADEVIQLPEKMGIGMLRWHQLRNFLETDFDFLYMTDNDVIHDPQYIKLLEVLYDTGGQKLPVSLFNSVLHMKPGTILYYNNGIILKMTAPAISMFFDRKMVEKIVSGADKAAHDHDSLSWDDRVIDYLALPWVTPETSYLEHFGADGINNSDYERDRAVNPTKYLQERREPILKYLTQDIGMQINF